MTGLGAAGRADRPRTQRQAATDRRQAPSGTARVRSECPLSALAAHGREHGAPPPLGRLRPPAAGVDSSLHLAEQAVLALVAAEHAGAVTAGYRLSTRPRWPGCTAPP